MKSNYIEFKQYFHPSLTTDSLTSEAGNVKNLKKKVIIEKVFKVNFCFTSFFEMQFKFDTRLIAKMHQKV